MAYSAAAVANAFIRIAATEKGMTLSNLKLQKLIYFAHGWRLALVSILSVSDFSYECALGARPCDYPR